MTLLKICGVTNVRDAQWVIGYADYVGVIVASSIKTPRLVDEGTAREILRVVGRERAVAVIEGLKPQQAARYASELGFSLVQYHNHVSREDLRVFGDYGIRVIPVITYNGQCSLGKAIPPLLSLENVEYVLIDAPKVGFRMYEHGLKIPLSIISEASSMGRVGIAGGINPDNASLVMRYRPYLIDVSSGVERTPGIKDEELVRRLHRVVKG
ncbi:phosphoribosylanthranilate isomerase [Vulcanisaeta thermophila]|uniref:phosphoribosylanthranilate isomerase n=1 Tax=Vulcanisaeta thermophila TaxID=867917 RepID=UPI000853EA79|nr:N-(5'-phosphoribosyl)anthranilate isomerase [Vulcanisaeta thermophila]